MDWVYNEMKQTGTDYSDFSEVEKYDARMQELRDIDEEVEKIIRLTNLSEAETLLDMGTGTGELAVKLAEYCEKIYAVDISKAMLEYADEKTNQRQVKNIEFRHTGFLTNKLDENSIDVIITQLALHHLPDFWKMVALKRMFELLKTGGRLYIYDVVFDFEIANYEEKINEFIELTRQASEKMVEGTKVHIKEEFSTFSWVLEKMIKKAGFSIEKVEYESELLGTYVCKKN